MTEMRSASLVERIPSKKGITFLRAEWGNDASPLVAVRYRYHSEEHTLQMDVDKIIFLDHLDDPENEEFVQSQVKPIWEIIAKKRREIFRRAFAD